METGILPCSFIINVSSSHVLISSGVRHIEFFLLWSLGEGGGQRQLALCIRHRAKKVERVRNCGKCQKTRQMRRKARKTDKAYRWTYPGFADDPCKPRGCQPLQRGSRENVFKLHLGLENRYKFRNIIYSLLIFIKAFTSRSWKYY